VGIREANRSLTNSTKVQATQGKPVAAVHEFPASNRYSYQESTLRPRTANETWTKSERQGVVLQSIRPLKEILKDIDELDKRLLAECYPDDLLEKREMLVAELEEAYPLEKDRLHLPR
jgi:hypothetical protein